MTPEERQRAVERLVEELPEMTGADDLMISAVRHGVSPYEWINASPEVRQEMKRQVYAHLKRVANVELLDDKLTREDIEHVQEAITHIKNAYQELVQYQATTGSGIAVIELGNAMTRLEKALEK